MIKSKTARRNAQEVVRARGTVGRRGRSLLLLTSALGCSLMVIAAPAARAADECGAAAATVTCPAGSYASGISYTGVTNLSLSLTAPSTVENGVVIVGTGQLGLAAPTGVTIANANGSGVYVEGETGAVNVSVDSASSSTDGGAGIVVTTTSGDVSVTSNTVSNTGHWVVDGHTSDGVAVITGSGDITIDAGETSVAGQEASGVVGWTDTGDVSITSDDVTSSGQWGNGIYGRAGTAGTVTIVSGTVTSTDNGNGAIIATGHDGVTVTSGSVSTTGALDLSVADGIYATSAAGAVTIDSESATTIGAGARGIHARAATGVAIESGSVSTAGDGVLVTGGYRAADAINALSTTGNVTITSEEIETAGVGAAGIRAGADAGDVTITSGSIATGGGYTFVDGDLYAAAGIWVDAGQQVTIDSQTITTTGMAGGGIVVEGVGAASITSDSIQTSNDGGVGVYAEAEGAVTIVSGSVITAGGVASAEEGEISAIGINAESVSGPVNITSGVVQTSGDYAEGIAAYSETGSIVIDSTTLSTEGDFAHGIFGEAGAGSVTITSGQLATSGDSAMGIFALTTSGAITINATDTVATGDTIFDEVVNPNEFYADAITAITQTGAISITSHIARADGLYTSAIAAVAGGGGDISIDSDEASGAGFGGVVLQANALGAPGGNVVVHSDSITVEGVGRGSLSALGSGDVTVVSGAITNNSVFGVDEVDGAQLAGSGLFAYSTGGDVSVDSGTISTVSDFGRGLVAQANAGSVTVISNSVTTQSARGIQLGASGAIELTSQTVSTAGPGAHGIMVTAGSGPVTIDSGAITTVGGSSHGIYVANAGGADIAGIGGWRAATGGTGLLDINSATIDAGGWGMMIDHQGAIDIDSQSITSGGSGIYLYGGDTVTITSGLVETENGAGIIVWGDDGLVTINSEEVTVGAGGDVGVFAQTTTGKIVINAGDTTTTATGLVFGNYTADAVGAISDTGDITITSGHATTVGYATSGIYAFTDGVISVTSTTITAGGDQGNGIYVAGNGAITIDSGIISTTGANKDGIIVEAGAGDVLITSDQIGATGAGSHGILVTDHELTWGQHPAAGGTGLLTLDSGSINVTDVGLYVDHAGAIDITSDHITSGGPGLYVYGAGAIDIDSGTVTSSAGPAIVVWGGEGDITLASDEATAGATGDVGIWARASSGDIVINAGTTTTNNTGVVDGVITADAVVGWSDTGDVTITSQIASAKGEGSSGIVGWGDEISVTSGSVTNSGLNGNGIIAEGNVVTVSSQTISTTGNGAAYALGTYAEGDLTITSGAITTTGALVGTSRAYGMSATSNAGSIDVTSGSVSTLGDRAFGIGVVVNGGEGDIVVNSTTVSTAGAGARGITAQTIGSGALTIVSGSVTTTGALYDNGTTVMASEGIRALAGTGAISIDSGSVSTAGAASHGIFAVGDGDVNIVSGDVTAGGEGAHAIFAATAVEEGGIDIDVAGDVSSAHGYGILASTDFASAHVNIDILSGSVSGSEGAIAVDGDNDVILNVAGHLSTSGDVAVILGAGDDVVTLQTGANVVGALYAADGADVLNLNSTVNTGIGIGQTMDDLIGFETINVQNGHWTLGGGAEADATSITGGTLVVGGSLMSDVVIGANGTLQIGEGGTTGELLGDLVVGGTVIFNRSDEYDYAGALSGAGSLVKRGASRLVLSGAYNFTGATVVEGGTIKILQLPDTAEVVVDDGVLDLSGQEQELGQLSGGSGGEVNIEGGALTLNQAATTTFEGAITGSGSLTLTGGGEINLTGENTYTGPTTIDEGTLRVNGSITSNVTVTDGGVLGGSGEIMGDVVVATGGVVGPGNSPGTLQVAGDFTFADNSTYEVEVEANGDHDLLEVGGVTTIGEDVSVEVLAGNGDYARLTRHTILTSVGGISGEFNEEVSTNLAFLDARLEQGANAVDLILIRNDVAFASFAANANQASVASALQQAGFGDALYDALVVQSAEGAEQGYAALSGELYAGIGGVLVQQGEHVRKSVLGHAGREGEGQTVWGELLGTKASFSGDADYAALESDGEGVAAGLDTSLNGWRAGVAIALVQSDVKADDLASTADVQSTTVSAYAGRQVGWLSATVGASYAWHSVEAERSVAFPSFADATRADYDATSLELFTEFSLRGESAGTFFEPFFGAALTKIDGDDVSERGGVAALSLEGEDRTVVSQTFGVRAWHPVETGFGSVAPYASLAWRGVAGDGEEPTNAAFQSNAARFTVTGAPLDNSAFVLDLGVKVTSDRFNVNAAYSQADGDRWEDERLNVGVAFKF